MDKYLVEIQNENNQTVLSREFSTLDEVTHFKEQIKENKKPEYYCFNVTIRGSND